MGNSVKKSSVSKNKYLLLIIIACVITLWVKPFNIERVFQSSELVDTSHNIEPLLLNAGLVQAQKAELSIILWVENGIIPSEVWTQLPMPDWVWSVNEQQTKHGYTATLSGHRVIDKDEERMLYSWYSKIAPIIAKDGVRIYLDERVSEGIDVSAYLSQSNILPAQWFLLDNMVSIAGYQSNFGECVMAGQDRINIQLLSRGQNTNGQTVLAIPALLKEF